MTKSKPATSKTADLLALTQDIRLEQTQMLQSLAQLANQTNFLRILVMQLPTNLGEQLNNLKNNDETLIQELEKLTSAGAQRAMAAVFYKFFRDQVGLMNQLDALVATGAESLAKTDPAWMDSLVALRNHLEKILLDWGCEAIPVKVSEDHYAAEIHEAVPALEGEIPPGAPANVIQVVRRRGWRLHGVILQYPQVVVS